MNAINEPAKYPTSAVTIISIWSKAPEIGRNSNVAYTVEVPTQATAEATLERAFALTNQDDRPMARGVCSTSAGDIMVLDGEHYLVESCGYHKLTLAESTKIFKLI